MRQQFIRDIAGMFRLAAPVILAELGWMSMGTVDNIMVGPLGPAAIGATGIGGNVYYAIAIFALGLLLGLDTLVSQSHGAGDKADTHHSLAQGIYAALLIGVPLTFVFAHIAPVFDWLGVNPQIGRLAGPYIQTLGFGTLPLLLYAACRRYLQGIGHVRPVMFALVSANLINWLFNWLLIFGHAGLPKLGVVGSALSTCLARCYMFGVLLFFVWWYERGQTPGFRALFRKLDPQRLFLLLSLGLPAATQILLEIGAFGAAAVLAGRLSIASLAAHQIAINCASITFMMPLGISSAAAVAVGQAIGRGDPSAARRSGWVAIFLSCCFMACSATAFLLIPQLLISIFTDDADVHSLGVHLLAAAAAFQLFDGIQTVTTGALRGAGNTRMPMLINFAGYWLFGLPIGYWLCFARGAGVIGVWWGLTLALTLIALALLWEWRRVRL